MIMCVVVAWGAGGDGPDGTEAILRLARRRPRRADRDHPPVLRGGYLAVRRRSPSVSVCSLQCALFYGFAYAVHEI